MKLKEYIQHLNALVHQTPEALEMDVITSIDDEGNGYNHVHYHPGVCHFDGGEIYTENDCEENGSKPNAVLLN